jgi:hypothetical protein
MSKGSRLTDLAQPVLTAPARELLVSVTSEMIIQNTVSQHAGKGEHSG